VPRGFPKQLPKDCFLEERLVAVKLVCPPFEDGIGTLGVRIILHDLPEHAVSASSVVIFGTPGIQELLIGLPVVSRGEQKIPQKQ
jgi:hypothetical protein